MMSHSVVLVMSHSGCVIWGSAVTEAKHVNISRQLPLRARMAPALSLKLCFMMMVMFEAHSSFSNTVCCLPRRDGFVAAHVEQLATVDTTTRCTRVVIMRDVNEQQTCYPPSEKTTRAFVRPDTEWQWNLR